MVLNGYATIFDKLISNFFNALNKKSRLMCSDGIQMGVWQCLHGIILSPCGRGHDGDDVLLGDSFVAAKIGEKKK